MRTRRILGAAVTTACVVTGLVASPASAGSSTSAAAGATAGSARTWVVLFAEGASVDAGTAAVRRAGGTVVRTNAALGTATVTADAGFAARVTGSAAVAGAAQDRSIGHSPATARPKAADVERLTAERHAGGGATARKAPAPGVPAAEPLADLQWDMRLIGATPTGSYAVQRGNKGVRVGIMDTGVDGTHPDIAPNFDRALSRNFVVDRPDIDGPCEHLGCVDPVDEDDNEHGTHVAGTIGSPINGQGIAGVAPDVDLVSVRAGQDSGYFFLQPTLDALTYSADAGLDVVNMSFYIDPWLFNCTANPADTPEQQQEQRTIIAATQRALKYAHKHDVTLVAALGNEETDLGHPMSDTTSPDYPVDAKGDPVLAHDRTIDNSCLSLPAEGAHVIGVSSVGPSTRKAYYSNYGTEQTDVSAPGGDFRDLPGTNRYKKAANLVLAPYPANVAREKGDLNADGTPKTAFVVQDHGAYYQYLQGTSMAAPHAVGVAALIVSQYGHRDRHTGGLTLNANKTEKILLRTATDTPCPTPATLDYPDPDLGAAYTATCTGTEDATASTATASSTPSERSPAGADRPHPGAPPARQAAPLGVPGG